MRGRLRERRLCYGAAQRESIRNETAQAEVGDYFFSERTIWPRRSTLSEEKSGSLSILGAVWMSRYSTLQQECGGNTSPFLKSLGSDSLWLSAWSMTYRPSQSA